jgi:hypothetical protein
MTTWLTRDEAAAYCGLKISRFNELVRLCKIPWGGSSMRRKYDRDVLDFWLRRRFQPQPEEQKRRGRRGRQGAYPQLREVLGQIDSKGGLVRLYDRIT